MKALRITSEKMAIGGLAMSMLLASLGVSTPNVALPTLAKQFNASFPQVQVVILSYLIAVTVMIVSAGRFGDLFGRRKVYLIGTIIFSTAALICGLAQNLWIIVGARAIQGIGAAILMAMSIALISELAPKGKTGGAMGLMGTMSAVGTASGPTVGGLLISGFGWRSVFFLMLFLGLLSFLVSRRFIPEDTQKREASAKSEQFDFVGTLVLGISLTTYSLGLSLNSGEPFKSANWILIAIAVLAGAVFIKLQTIRKSPLLRLDLLLENNLSSNLLMNIIVSTVMMSTLIVGPFYLSRGLGLETAMVGAAMSVGPILSMLSGIPAGKIVDRLGSRSVTKLGLSLMALGAAFMSVLPQLFGIIGYIASAAVLSPGYQLFQAANNTAVMESVNASERGVISGLLSLSRNIGLISGTSIMGSVFAFSIGTNHFTEASPDSLSYGMRVTFMIATILILVAISISFRSIKNSYKKGIL